MSRKAKSGEQARKASPPAKGQSSALEKLIDAYCAAWDEPNSGRRDTMLKEAWADGGAYTDPTVHVIGRQRLVEHIGNVLLRYPNSRILRTSTLDAHHGLVRFTWKRVLADGRSLPEGIDIVEVSKDGKVQRVIGFFGPLARVDHSK